MQGNNNPAKQYLQRYRWAIKRADALRAAIADARERATGTVQRTKAVQVLGGAAAYDRMADDVCTYLEATEQLETELKEVDKALQEVMTAIKAVPDEAQKTVLMMRYVCCMSWQKIQEALHYEQTQVFVLHGRGLLVVNKWLRRDENRDSDWLAVLEHGTHAVFQKHDGTQDAGNGSEALRSAKHTDL